jgi:hypothetical protein
VTNSTLYVFGRTSNSGPFTERGNVTLTNGQYYYGGATELLVADADGDGEQEFYVAFSDGNYYPTAWSVKVYDRNLQLLRSLSLTRRVTNFALEPSTIARKNLLISTAGDSSSYYAPGPTEVWAIDPVSGAGVWRSPAFAGEFGRNSLNVIDVQPDGQYKLSFGTAVGAFVTR